jgi:hypothetical protein
VKLAVDVDDTLWDMRPNLAPVLKELTGIEYVDEDNTHWYAVDETFGQDRLHEAFDIVLDPAKVEQREFFPHVGDALNEIREDGVDIHFVTHSKYGERMRPPLTRWLKTLFGDDWFYLSISVTGDKIPILKREGAFGIIDDKMYTLLRAREKGYWCATPLFMHRSRLFHQNNPDIPGFSSWKQVPSMVRYALRQATVGGRS